MSKMFESYVVAWTTFYFMNAIVPFLVATIESVRQFEGLNLKLLECCEIK
jgi:hypothetical protein